MLLAASISACSVRRGLGIILGAVVCSLAAQAQNEESELAQQRDAFIAKVFTKYNDGIYYFGPHQVNRLACIATGRDVIDCAELIEYKDFAFPQARKIERQAGSNRVVPLNPPGTLDLRLSSTNVYAQNQQESIAPH